MSASAPYVIAPVERFKYSVLAVGLKQTAHYAQMRKASEAHLVIFNRDKAAGWDEKI